MLPPWSGGRAGGQRASVFRTTDAEADFSRMEIDKGRTKHEPSEADELWAWLDGRSLARGKRAEMNRQNGERACRCSPSVSQDICYITI